MTGAVERAQPLPTERAEAGLPVQFVELTTFCRSVEISLGLLLELVDELLNARPEYRIGIDIVHQRLRGGQMLVDLVDHGT